MNPRKLRWLFARRRREADLAEELAFHLEEEAQERGYDAARRELGNVGLIKEDTRAMWGWTCVEQLLQDLRYATRTMRNNPAFTALAALSLALGIGANTAIYSFMDAVIMRWLPVRDPESLVLLQWHTKHRTDDSVVQGVSGHFDDDPKLGLVGGIFPYPAFEELRKSTKLCSALFAYHPSRRLTVMVTGGAEVAIGEYVSGDFFRGLGVASEAGRLIVADDDRMGTDVVVVSYGFAQRHFGDAVRAVGQKIFLNNLPFTIAGVTRPGFYGVDSGSAPEFYLPLRADVALDPADGGKPSQTRYLNGHYYWIEIMGRLRPGVTLKQAQAQMGPVFQNWVASTAENDAQRANLPRFLLSEGARGVDRLRRNFEEPLVILMAMVALILAIACANIANLLLARATARRREMAVRLSIGAGRWRVIRQLLTESVLLASIGGFGGVLVAYWAVPILRATLASGSSFILRAELNVHALAITAALTMITGVLFGLVPALQATRVDTMPVLKELRTAEPRGRLPVNLSQVLVIAQIAISLVLVAAAELFVQTLSKLQSLDMGFTRENVLVFQLNAEQAGHQTGELLSFYRGLEQRFSTIPGVISVAEADSPLIGQGAWGWAVVPVGKPKPEHAPSGHGSFGGWENTHTLQVDAHFLSTMKIRLLSGRGFNERDRAGSAPVVIVNEAWVKANLPGRNAVGERVVSYGLDDKPVQMDVIGVAKNAMYNRIDEDFPATVYLSLDQNLGSPVEEMTFFLRTSGDPLKCTGAVREIVHETDARIPVTNIATQEQRIETEIGEEILFARLSAGFALLALAISCVGLYATMSYLVARRTGEIGIRMALGAARGRVLSMIMRQVAILAAVGLAIGLPVAFGASRLVGSLLYGVKAGDPASIVTAVATIVIAAVAAGYVPARRASRIDPLVALRHE
ncbi:MAG: ABC transporter permease [Acidobacteriaceae bacterium]|nr:ABC transporter permease [Acidobacteriaceae bacterium]